MGVTIGISSHFRLCFFVGQQDIIIFTCGDMCLVYIRLRFPVLFRSVTISDVTIMKNPWAIELKMEMLKLL